MLLSSSFLKLGQAEASGSRAKHGLHSAQDGLLVGLGEGLLDD